MPRTCDTHVPQLEGMQAAIAVLRWNTFRPHETALIGRQHTVQTISSWPHTSRTVHLQFYLFSSTVFDFRGLRGAKGHKASDVMID